jgi:outer membrane protein assembly factor BamB
MMKAIVALAALALLAGCQTVSDSYDRIFHGGKPPQPPAELVAFKAVATPKVLWQGSAGSSEKNVFYPAVSGNVIYAAGAAGQITLFDASKGGTISRVEAGQRISGGVGITPLMSMLASLAYDRVTNPVRFIHAAVESSERDAAWTAV